LVADPENGDEPLVEFPVFGEECQGHPNICYSCLTVDLEKEGAFFTYGNYSQETMTYGYKLVFISEKGFDVLADLGDMYPNIIFDVENDMGYAIIQAGKWPDTYHMLYSGSLSEENKTTLLMDNITYGQPAELCRYPSGFNMVKKKEGPPDLFFTCSKDWQKPGDENKIALYSGGVGLNLVTSQADYYGYLTVLKDDLYYSQWVSNPDDWKLSKYELYSCYVYGCVPEKVGELPLKSNWNFLITGSGDLLTTQYVKWDSDAGKSVYNVTVTPNLGNGTATYLFESSGFNNAQLLKFDDPVDGTGSPCDV